MSTFDPINFALNVEAETVEEPVEKENKVHDLTHVSDEASLEETSGLTTMSDSDRDYEYTRAQLYSLIEKGQEAVNGALELATEGDSARSYEVVGGLIKNVADTADKLLELQKKVKDLDTVTVNNNQTNVTNNSVFVGSTSELQKLIKEGMLNKLPE